MRLKKVKNAREVIDNSRYYVKFPETYKGKWYEIFGNSNPIHIEIGMGKGKFISAMAKNFPNINFIGLEKYDSVLVKAVKSIENEKLNNLKLILIDAENIETIFDKEIEKIYLNFSDPWPKSKHEKRRLTSKEFLERYDNLFADTKEIIQKTDNLRFFEFSKESLTSYGYKIISITYDLQAETAENNFPTEYEEKFIAQGTKINKLVASKE